jgi:hypothetical protein
MNMGNELSVAGNVAMFGGTMIMAFLPRVLYQLRPRIVSVQHWWVVIPMACVAAAFYFISLKLTSALFRSRREYLMALMEGRLV